MFDYCLYFNTSALARRLEREWVVAFGPFDLTPPQAFMLRAILAKPGMLQKELATELGISRPTATRILDGLDTKKLVVRRGSTQDGREWSVHPTPAAAEIQKMLNDASGSVTKRLKKLLGEDNFIDIVTKVRGVRSALK